MREQGTYGESWFSYAGELKVLLRKLIIAMHGSLNL